MPGARKGGLPVTAAAGAGAGVAPGQDHQDQPAGSRDQDRHPAPGEVGGASRGAVQDREAGLAAGQAVGPGGEVRAAPGANLGLDQPAAAGPAVRAAPDLLPDRDLQWRDQDLRTECLVLLAGACNVIMFHRRERMSNKLKKTF